MTTKTKGSALPAAQTVASPEARYPDPVDVHCGAKIRLLRKLRGLSQQALANEAGVTFQQIQKYERGANRVSASMLVKICGTLGIRPGELLDDAPGAKEAHRTDPLEWVEARRIVGTVGGAYDVLKALDRMPGDVRTGLVQAVLYMDRAPGVGRPAVVE